MRLTQLIYASRPFGFDIASLNGILDSARRNNARTGLTGTLICRADIYLQLLEGPRDKVTKLFERIMDDDRHLDVMLVSVGDAETRLFPDWAMRDDPAPSWLWSQREVDAGALENAMAGDVRAVFERVAAQPVLARAL